MKKRLILALVLMLGFQFYVQAQYISTQPLSKYSYCTPGQNIVAISVSLKSPLPSGGVLLNWQKQGNGGVWMTIASLAGIAGQNTFMVDAGIYRVIVDPNMAGLSSETSNSTTVFEVSNAPNINLTASGIFNCVNSSVTLTINNTGGEITETAWTFSNNPYLDSLTESIIVQNAGSYGVTASNACNSNFGQVMLGSDYQAPSNISFSPPTPILLCASPGTVKITITANPSNSTAAWTGPQGSVISLSGNTLEATVNKTGTYNVTVTHPISKCTSTTSVTVVAGNDFPSANITPPEKITCIKPSVTLMAVPINDPTTVQWYLGNNPVPQTGGTITVSSGGSYRLNLQKGSCENNLLVQVAEDKTPPGFSLPETTGFCEGGSVKLKADVQGSASDFSFVWSGSPSVTTQEKEVMEAGNYTVTVTKNSNGCTDSKTVEVGEYETPVLSKFVTPITFQVGDPPITFGPDIDPVDADMDWKVLDFENVTLTQSQMQGPGKITRTFSLDGSEDRTIGAVLYSFVPKNQGCIGDSVIIEIDVLPRPDADAAPFIPEIYTPNGDGQNDVWQVAMPDGVEMGEYTIFNRLGGKVYAGDTLTPWDGSGCPDGPYFYVLRYEQDGEEKVVKGAVTILRTTD